MDGWMYVCMVVHICTRVWCVYFSYKKQTQYSAYTSKADERKKSCFKNYDDNGEAIQSMYRIVFLKIVYVVSTKLPK